MKHFIFTSHNEVAGRLCFHERVSFLLSTGGVGLPRGDLHPWGYAYGGSASRGLCIGGWAYPNGYYRTWSPSRWYTSYWNTFLFEGKV